jgi:hypothetical protein
MATMEVILTLLLFLAAVLAGDEPGAKAVPVLTVKGTWVLDAEGRWCAFQRRLREAKQETKGIAVRGDCVGTGPELSHESVREELVEERRKRRSGHCPPPARRPLSGSVASCSNSGMPPMYQ